MIHFPNQSDLGVPTDSQGNFNPFPSVLPESDGVDIFLNGEGEGLDLGRMASPWRFVGIWGAWTSPTSAPRSDYQFLRAMNSSSRAPGLILSAAFSRNTMMPLPVTEELFVRELIAEIDRVIQIERGGQGHEARLTRAAEIRAWEDALREVTSFLPRSQEVQGSEQSAQRAVLARQRDSVTALSWQDNPHPNMLQALALHAANEEVAPGSLRAYLYDFYGCEDRQVLSNIVERLIRLYELEVPGQDLSRHKAELLILLQRFPFGPRHFPVIDHPTSHVFYASNLLGYVQWMNTLRTLGERFGNEGAAQLYQRYLTETHLGIFTPGSEVAHHFAIELAIAHLERGEAVVSRARVLEAFERLAASTSVIRVNTGGSSHLRVCYRVSSPIPVSLLRLAYAMDVIAQRTPNLNRDPDSPLFNRARDYLIYIREGLRDLPRPVLERMRDLGNLAAAHVLTGSNAARTSLESTPAVSPEPARNIPTTEFDPSVREFGSALERLGGGHIGAEADGLNPPFRPGGERSGWAEGLEIFLRGFREAEGGEEREFDPWRRLLEHRGLRGIR